MSNKLVKEMTDEEKILMQGFKMGATAAFMASGQKEEDITDALLEGMYKRIIMRYANRKNAQN